MFQKVAQRPLGTLCHFLTTLLFSELLRTFTYLVSEGATLFYADCNLFLRMGNSVTPRFVQTVGYLGSDSKCLARARAHLASDFVSSKCRTSDYLGCVARAVTGCDASGSQRVFCACCEMVLAFENIAHVGLRLHQKLRRKLGQ